MTAPAEGAHDGGALAPALVAGAGTGLRAFTPLATVLAGDPHVDRRLRGLVAAAAVQELVMDKLPKTPSRLGAIGLGARVVTAGACGFLLARRREAPHPQQVLTATVAAGAALGTAYLGARWRWWGAPRLGSDLRAALLEDLVALGLAGIAAQG